jgi:HTH-type transcriptional regulator, global nitrogen regulator NrpRI
MSFESQQDVERKILSILKVLNNLPGPAGSRIIAKQLNDIGIALSERAVRYHLKLTDERGLTQLVTDRDGRTITDRGRQEIENAMVTDKIGFVISRIELLAYRTQFDYEQGSGIIPVNVSFFSEMKFKQAVKAMSSAFEAGFCVSDKVTIATGGHKLGEVIVPLGKVGLATVCSIVINGTLLKAGIPMDSKFGGTLQLRNSKPVRFTQVIHYNGSSLDPSEIFVRARMTSVSSASSNGNGEILANFREIPAICRPTAEEVIHGLRNAGFNGVLMMGQKSCKVCETDVEINKIGIILTGGLNPIAAAAEAGIEAENRSMSTLIDYKELAPFRELLMDTTGIYALSAK